MTSISQKGKFLKMTAVELLFRRFSLCSFTSSNNLFCKKYTPSHPFDFEILLGFWEQKYQLQVSGKRLTTCIIHYFSFTTHNYRMRTLQIQSWHKYSISGVFLSLATRIKMLQTEIISLKNASAKNLKNILLTSRFQRDLQNLVWL